MTHLLQGVNLVRIRAQIGKHFCPRLLSDLHGREEVSTPTSPEPVRVLILEDTESDAALVEHELREGGIVFEAVRAATEEDFLFQLESFRPDIILADYSLPQYDGLSALSVSQARHRETPFILVTGSLDEETAVDCIKAGASDYVVKERLFRLGPAVKSALDKRRAAMALDVSEAQRTRLSAAIDQADEIVMITDPSGRIQYVNPAFEEVTGYTAEEVHGKNPSILNGGELEDAVFADLWQTITGGHSWRGRLVNRKKNGMRYEEDAVISPVVNPSGKIVNFVAVKRDVTHEVELEHQLVQSQKMEAVGQLAGGVAHDFNNLLMVILNSALFLQEETRPDTEARSLVDDILAAANQASGLTRQLLAFSRRQMLTPKNEDINLIVSELQKMLKRLLHENIDIRMSLMSVPCSVRVDRGQIEQVLMNLAVNARDAMPDGGTLFLDVQCRDLDVNWMYVHSSDDALTPGRYAVLTVSDTGCGMAEDQALRIFDPFYTTKPAGQGTGLGLSTVYGIVNQHGGRITVYSHPGQGTTFHIYLPCTEGGGDEAATPSVIEEMPSGTEKVLLVEDAPAVRQVTERILRNLGYQTASAACGEDALTLIQQAGHGYDLLLSDIVMPGMDGCELAKRVREESSDIRILFMSGYPEPMLKRRHNTDALGAVLNKPFSAEELAVAIRTALDT